MAHGCAINFQLCIQLEIVSKKKIAFFFLRTLRCPGWTYSEVEQA